MAAENGMFYTLSLRILRMLIVKFSNNVDKGQNLFARTAQSILVKLCSQGCC